MTSTLFQTPTTLAAWFHDLNPIALPIKGDFIIHWDLAIRWYGLSYLTGFLIAWLVLRRLGQKGLVRIPPHLALDAIITIVVGVILGGRLGYALVYDPRLFVTFHNTLPYWDLLAVQKGGMASHGAMVGIILGCWRVSSKREFIQPPLPRGDAMLHTLDVMGLISPFGLFLGRCANFINGELLGKVVTPPGTPGPWWTVQFPQELRAWVFDESAGRLISDPNTHGYALSPDQQHMLFTTVDALRTTGETWNAALDRVLAHAGAHQAELAPLISSRHPSQLYQAFAEGIVLLVCVWLIWMKPRKPGVIAAWWLMIYGVLRVLTEVWRLPDAQFGEAGRIIGLSRGQWLSVAMVVAGGVLLLVVTRRGANRLGGWAATRAAPKAGEASA